MVDIITEYKPVYAFVGSDLELKCQVDGLGGNYVICWFYNDNKITQVDDVGLVSSDGATHRQKQRLFPSVNQPGVNNDRVVSLTITNAQELDEGIYSLGVYERRQDGNLSLTAKKDIADISVASRCQRTYDILRNVDDNLVETSDTEEEFFDLVEEED